MADNFDALLEEMDVLAKAMPGTDDDKIEAAAADGETGEQTEGDATEADGEVLKKDLDAADGEDMSKSFRVTLPNGEETDAVDGTELVKSLRAENDALKARLDAAETLLAGQTGDLAKSLKVTSGVMDLVKSLGAQVTALRSGGVGRRSTIDVRERADLTAGRSDPNDPNRGLSREEIFAKADALFSSGDLTGFDIARIEGHLNGGYALPPQYHSKIFTAAGARG